MQNSVCLTGRLTHDIEVKTFESGDRVTSFSLAVQRNYKNKQGDYDCDFINCQARNGTADLLFKYFKKGDFCPIQGELRTRKYEKDGVTHTITFVDINNITFVSKKDTSTSQSSAQSDVSDVMEFSGDNIPNMDEVFSEANNDDLPF